MVTKIKEIFNIFHKYDSIAKKEKEKENLLFLC